MRMPHGPHLAAALFCVRCSTRSTTTAMRARMIYEVKRGILDHPLAEMAYLFTHGERIRIVWGHALGSEVIA